MVDDEMASHRFTPSSLRIAGDDDVEREGKKGPSLLGLVTHQDHKRPCGSGGVDPVQALRELLEDDEEFEGPVMDEDSEEEVDEVRGGHRCI